MVVIVMGVAGAGKTTVGQALATRLGWRFLDADAFHTKENVAKMAAGVALDDSDRAPWLARLGEEVRGALGRGEDTVLACSGLKASYRSLLGVGLAGVKLVLLTAPAEVLAARRAHPKHFFAPALLTSQLATLEPPLDALVVDTRASVDECVEQIVRWLPAT
jgi:gluconokinase